MNHYRFPSLRCRCLFTSALLITTSLVAYGAAEDSDTPVAESSFREHYVEFHNGEVKLAGSLLVPEGDGPHPAVVFVHGAGRHTRKGHREIGSYFAGQGIAALIYDKRGTGDSTGVYESRKPYTNLTDDALSAVALLKQRPEIDESQIGIWGLSQGAYISAAAASRSEDIKFVIAAGASVCDGSFFYYCDNLFRKYGLSDKLRDIAAKAHFARWDFGEILSHGFSLTSFTPRTYPTPDQYLHPSWSHVNQPVLALWGDLDQNVPVGESVAGMKNSLAHANNERWTMVVLPEANHDLGISGTGELQSKWRGYAPGALKTMTDWTHKFLTAPSRIDERKQVGMARDAGILTRYASYENLRWYGNAAVQITLWILFFTAFLIGAVLPIWRRLRCGAEPASSSTDWLHRLRTVLSVLNLLIMLGFSILALFVIDQMHPSCPGVLSFLPILGALSMLGTITLLIGTAMSPQRGLAIRNAWRSVETACLILFVPFMLYWNLVGYRL